LSTQIGVPNIPNSGYTACQTRSQCADKVGMVHPRLNQVRRFVTEPLCEPEKSQRARHTPPHTERANGNGKSLNFSAYGADICQRKHFRFEDVAINLRKQLEQHRLCTTNRKAGNQVQDLDHSTLSRTSEVL